MEDMIFQLKVVAVQSELKAPKGQYNSFGNYKYRSCEDILEGVKPLLKEYKLVLLINDEIVQIGERYYVKATAKITDGVEVISATAYAREPEAKKGMDESQITGATSSYARKYALNGLLAIDDSKDADTVDNGEKTIYNQKRRREPQNEPMILNAQSNTESVVNTMLINEIVQLANASGIDTNKLSDYVITTFNKPNCKALDTHELNQVKSWVSSLWKWN